MNKIPHNTWFSLRKTSKRKKKKKTKVISCKVRLRQVWVLVRYYSLLHDRWTFPRGWIWHVLHHVAKTTYHFEVLCLTGGMTSLLEHEERSGQKKMMREKKRNASATRRNWTKNRRGVIYYKKAWIVPWSASDKLLGRKRQIADSRHHNHGHRY